MMKSAWLIGIFMLQLFTIFAQEVELVPWSREYEMKEGIYLDFDQFRWNSPVPFSQLTEKAAAQFSEKNRFDIDDQIQLSLNGKDTLIEANQLFGFNNGNTFIRVTNQGFARIGIMGSICHFSLMVAVQQNVPAGMYGNSGIMMSHPTTSHVMMQFILDMKTGFIHEFTVENLEQIIASDEVMHNEFLLAFKKRNKLEEKKWSFFRAYNSKYPLLFPATD